MFVWIKVKSDSPFLNKTQSQIKALVKGSDQINDKQALDNTYEGWVDLGKLDSGVLSTDADYYICGPAPFITQHYKDLLEKGIKKDAIHFEEFGPQTLQL